MFRRLGNTLKAGLLLLLLTTALLASLILAEPASARPLEGDQGSCANRYEGKDPSQVNSNTWVYCTTDVENVCFAETNGFKTCAVRHLGNGLMFFALIACVAGIFVSAILWALGSKGQNPGQELTGKRGLIVCLAAAFVGGAYPILTTFYDNIARQTDNTGVTSAPPPTVELPKTTTTTG